MATAVVMILPLWYRMRRASDSGVEFALHPTPAWALHRIAPRGTTRVHLQDDPRIDING
jgi:hypothetical protein